MLCKVELQVALAWVGVILMSEAVNQGTVCSQLADVKLEAVVTCPNCGHKSNEIMPTQFCLIRYQCRNCSAILVPKEGDDCIFCSWSDTKCPSEQTISPEEAAEKADGHFFFRV